MIIGERKEKPVREYPCILEHRTARDIAIWHNERQFTVIVKGIDDRSGYRGKGVNVVVGELITAPERVINPSRYWIDVSHGAEFTLRNV